MAVEVKAPEVGESIREVLIATWLKHEGEQVELDESLAEIESDKATLELPAPAAGVLSRILKGEGETVPVGEVIALIEPGAVATALSPGKEVAAHKKDKAAAKKNATPAAPAGAPAVPPASTPGAIVMPAAARLLAERHLDAAKVPASGPGGRLLKEDVLRFAEGHPAPPPTAQPGGDVAQLEDVVPMSPIRRRIAERLVEAQHTMALLTTFNEVDMTEVIELRKRYREEFEKRYGVKLGFMSFFVKASIEALKFIPQVNAEIRGTDIVYKNHYDIGIAIGGGKGLVVPVLRGADRLSFGQVEVAIADFAQRATANKIDLEELKGGTFTISNGGVYGSMLSTPIVNPPQSGVLGLHAIQDRPVARDGQIAIRPMMYLALSYDHRIIDGREAVNFLKRIKELIENPARMLLEI